MTAQLSHTYNHQSLFVFLLYQHDEGSQDMSHSLGNILHAVVLPFRGIPWCCGAAVLMAMQWYCHHNVFYPLCLCLTLTCTAPSTQNTDVTAQVWRRRGWSRKSC